MCFTKTKDGTDVKCLLKAGLEKAMVPTSKSKLSAQQRPNNWLRKPEYALAKSRYMHKNHDQTYERRPSRVPGVGLFDDPERIAQFGYVVSACGERRDNILQRSDEYEESECQTYVTVQTNISVDSQL